MIGPKRRFDGGALTLPGGLNPSREPDASCTPSSHYPLIMDLGLRGKRAFVTGGTHGIGLAIDTELAAEGVAVAVCGRDAERLDAAVASLGPEAYGVKVDVTDPSALGTVIDEAASQLGGLDLLVANVGGGFGRGLLDSTPEDWTRTF